MNIMMNASAGAASIISALLVNGAALQYQPTASITNTSTNWIALSGTYFLTSTGATTIAISATCVYTSGTTILDGSLVIQTV